MKGKSPLPTLALILGVISFLGPGPLTGVAAWIIGTTALNMMDRGEIDDSERSLAKIGKILGQIVTILGIIGIVIWIGFLGFFFHLPGVIGPGTGNQSNPEQWHDSKPPSQANPQLNRDFPGPKVDSKGD